MKSAVAATAAAMLTILIVGCSLVHTELRNPEANLRESYVKFNDVNSVAAVKTKPVEDTGVGIEKKLEQDDVRVEEGKIQEMAERRVSLKFPAKVAIVKIEKSFGIFKPKAPEPEEMAVFAQALNDPNLISSVEPLPTVFLTDTTDLMRLRYTAAKIGAELLFIYIHDSSTVSNWNSASIANMLILPLFFVNGKTVEGAVAMEGVLVQVQTNTVHIVTAAKTKGAKDIHNLASREKAEKAMAKDLYDQTIKEIAEGLAKKLAAAKP